MRLRVIRDGARTGAENMAADADLLDAWRPGDDTVLRLYRWTPHAVSYGYHQQESDFDTEAISARGYGLVRRPTGGRAILHCDELTYAVVGGVRGPVFGDTLHTAYSSINDALVLFLRKLDLSPDVSEGESLAEARSAVCFQSAGRHEITVGGRKLVGSAQRRLADAFLQHGSILTGSGHVDLLACLKGGRDGALARARLLDATTHLGTLLNRILDESHMTKLEDTLIEAFAESYRCDIVS